LHANQLLMIAGFEIDLRFFREAVVDYRRHSVRLPDRWNGTELAVGERGGANARGRSFSVTSRRFRLSSLQSSATLTWHVEGRTAITNPSSSCRTTDFANRLPGTWANSAVSM